MNSKQSILTVYPVGGYGTFLDWALNWFTGQCDFEQLPFTNVGNAHDWSGVVIDMPNIRKTIYSKPMLDYLKSSEDFFSARTHGPLELRQKNLSCDEYHRALCNYIQTYSQYFKNIIILNPSPKNFLLFVHNYCTKLHPTKLYAELINHYEGAQVVDPVAPRAQQRSQVVNWYKRWYWFVRYFYQPVIEPTNVINVSVDSLVYDFKTTLISLFDRLGLEGKRFEYLDRIHREWQSSQKFINRDEQCNHIVNATKNRESFIFCHLDLHLFDEAYIIWKLETEHGLQLIANDVDILPTNTVQLRELFQTI